MTLNVQKMKDFDQNVEHVCSRWRCVTTQTEGSEGFSLANFCVYCVSIAQHVLGSTEGREGVPLSAVTVENCTLCTFQARGFRTLHAETRSVGKIQRQIARILSLFQDGKE